MHLIYPVPCPCFLLFVLGGVICSPLLREISSSLLSWFGTHRLSVLKQKLSPNIAQTIFISYEYVTIMVEPFNKTIRTAHDSELGSESVSSRYSCTKSFQSFRKSVQRCGMHCRFPPRIQFEVGRQIVCPASIG